MLFWASRLSTDSVCEAVGSPELLDVVQDNHTFELHATRTRSWEVAPLSSKASIASLGPWTGSTTSLCLFWLKIKPLVSPEQQPFTILWTTVWDRLKNKQGDSCVQIQFIDSLTELS